MVRESRLRMPGMREGVEDGRDGDEEGREKGVTKRLGNLQA